MPSNILKTRKNNHQSANVTDHVNEIKKYDIICHTAHAHWDIVRKL